MSKIDSYNMLVDLHNEIREDVLYYQGRAEAAKGFDSILDTAVAVSLNKVQKAIAKTLKKYE